MRDIINRLNSGTLAYDFIARRRRWYTISAVVVIICLGALLFRGLSLGIEFKGGADFQAPTQVTSQTVDQLRNAVVDSGVPDMDAIAVTTLGDNTVRVQTRTLSVDEVTQVRSAIAEQLQVSGDEVAYSLIGASWGKQITNKGITALIVFTALVMLVIWAYFKDWKMSIAAIIALLHDLVVTVGVYAIVGFTVTPATLIGVLTILGYSLYDTVVVFDKVRENVKDLVASPRRTYSEASNAALNQVMVRSLATTIIGVLPVGALLFAGVVVLGQGPLKDLALALFVGMIAGAYSSIFLAVVILAQMKEREPAMIKLAERVQRRRAGKGPERPRSKRAGAGAPGGATSMAVLERDGADPVSAEDEVSEEADTPGRVREAEIGQTRVKLVSDSADPVPTANPEGLGPRSSGASKRPQPQHSPRSTRKKK